MVGEVIELKTTQKSYYPLVRTKPLTARELRNNDLENYLFSVAVSFKTSSGRPYTATHFRNSSILGPVVRVRVRIAGKRRIFWRN
mgnify:CR=1 FL=1